MAYAFRRVASVLGNGVDPAAQNQNIFAPTGAGPQGGEAQQGGMPTSGRGVAKTNTEAEGATDSNQRSATSPQPSGAPQATAATQQSIYTKQADRQKAPSIATSLQDRLSGTRQALGNEADEWVKSATANSYAVGNDQLEKAIGGDEASGQAYRDLSGKNSETIKLPQGFKPTKTDLSGISQQIDDFQTDPGVQRALARESGPQYTQGEGAYDLMLLNRNADFQSIRQQLAQDKRALLDQSTEMEKTKTDEANATNAASLTKAQGDARGYLEGQGKTLTDAQATQMAAANASLATARKGLSGKSGADYDAVLAKLKQDYAGDPAGILRHLDESRVDPNAYNGVRGDYTDARDFVDADEAKRFSGIYSLLGQGAGGYDTAGQGAGETYTPTGDMYGDTFNRANAANTKADKAAQDQIDALVRANQAEADTINGRRGALGSDISQFLSAEQKAQLLAEMSEGRSRVWDTPAEGLFDQVNMGDFVKIGGQLDYRSLLDDKERGTLQSSLDELGQGAENPYDDIAYGEPGDDSSFDYTGYRSALLALAKKNRYQGGGVDGSGGATGGGRNGDGKGPGGGSTGSGKGDEVEQGIVNAITGHEGEDIEDAAEPFLPGSIARDPGQAFSDQFVTLRDAATKPVRDVLPHLQTAAVQLPTTVARAVGTGASNFVNGVSDRLAGGKIDSGAVNAAKNTPLDPRTLAGIKANNDFQKNLLANTPANFNKAQDIKAKAQAAALKAMKAEQARIAAAAAAADKQRKEAEAQARAAAAAASEAAAKAEKKVGKAATGARDNAVSVVTGKKKLWK